MRRPGAASRGGAVVAQANGWFILEATAVGCSYDTWSVMDTADAPERGLRFAGPVEAIPAGLLQCHARWVTLLVPLAAVSLALAVLVYLLRPVPMGAVGGEIPGWLLSILPFFLLANAGTLSLLAHYRFAGSWRLGGRKGTGELIRGPRGFRRRWSFPCEAVRQVIVGVEERRGGKRGTVQLRLQDRHGGADLLALCTCPLEKARFVATDVADWLRVAHVEQPYESRRQRMAVRVQPAGRRDPISIPATPVKKIGTSIRSSTVARDTGGTRITIRPSRGMLSACGLFAGMGSFWVLAPVFCAGDVAGRIVAGCFGTVFVLVGVLLYLSIGRWRFDRKAGQLRYRKGLHRARVLPFAQIAAIQGVYVGRFRGKQASYDTFELDLVECDGSRTTMARDKAGQWVRQTGRELARFIGVPWVNHLDVRDR